MSEPPHESLVRENLDLVAIVARQLIRELGLGARWLDELQGAGNEGLLGAARRFDPQRGVPFRRFANYRVRGAMIDALRRESSLPRRAYEQLRQAEIAQSLNEAASEEAPALASPGADDRLAEHLARLATALATGLVCQPGHEDGEPVAVEERESPEESVAREEMKQHVRVVVEALPEQERALIVGHYYDGRRLDEVSAELGLSKSWGSRLHSRAIARLTDRLREP